MSTPIIYLVNDAAALLGDPNKQRISQDQWLSIYNLSNRELCAKANVLKFEECFDLVALQQRYDYPEGMTVLRRLEVTETPADDASWKTLDELFEDEFRAAVTDRYPDATLPTSYFASENWFNLVPMATALIQGGGCITYFGLPDRITDIGQVLQVDDIAQDYLLRRMVIHGLQMRHRIDEAREQLVTWEADMVTFQDKLDDRSQDRRSTIAPRRNRYAGMR